MSSAGNIDIYFIALAIAREVQGVASEKDVELIGIWLTSSPQNKRLYQDLKAGKDRQAVFESMQKFRVQDALLRVHHQLIARRRTKVRKILIESLSAAAIVSGVLLLLFYRGDQSRPKVPLASRLDAVSPGGQRAVLVLNDGEQVGLGGRDSSFVRGAVIAVKTGSVTYLQSDDPTQGEAYHTLFTPKGGEYHLVLPDGTGAWLNAESSVRFPTAFKGPLRQVEVTGEAYFEVARKVQQPFRVVAGALKIAVLGTAFNLRAYPNEAVATTLISGAVNLQQRGSTMKLQIGERGYFDGSKLQHEAADTLTVMAWRRGLFRFRKTSMQQVALQLERWYNIRFEFDQNYNIQRQFNGEISREVCLSQVLTMLEKTGVGHFEIYEGKVLIMPAN